MIIQQTLAYLNKHSLTNRQTNSMTDFTLRQTFFDALLLSDSERIHSQMLGWILNLPDEEFSRKCKSIFLNSLFKFENKITIDRGLVVHTELNRIDVLLETDQYILVLENKLKSSEHSFQTQKYAAAVPEPILRDGKSIECGFITLIGEKPINDEWHSISFKDILTALDNVQWREESKDSLFVKEYIQTLKNLVGVFDSFMSNHKNYDTVFSDGSKKKHLKIRNEDALKDYIRTNQLETIFQKSFLATVAQNSKLKNFVVAETRGTALLQMWAESIVYQNKTYHLGLQFQGNCVKINLILPKNSKSIEVKANKTRLKIPEFLADCFGVTFSKQNNYNRFNRNNKNPYISVSKTLVQGIFEMEKEQLGDILKEELEFILSKVEDFKSCILRE